MDKFEMYEKLYKEWDTIKDDIFRLYAKSDDKDDFELVYLIDYVITSQYLMINATEEKLASIDKELYALCNAVKHIYEIDADQLDEHVYELFCLINSVYDTAEISSDDIDKERENYN